MNIKIEEYIDRFKEPEEFKKFIWDLSSGQQREAREYKSKDHNLFKLYRSRVYNNEPLPNKLLDLSYNPSPKSAGRCHNTGESVFYASSGAPTTFNELSELISVGSVVLVSEWHCASENIILNPVGFINLTGLYEEVIHSIFTENSNKYYQYSRENFNHLTSSVLIDGIIYPSVMSANGSENIALKKNIIDSGKLHFWNVKAYKVRSQEQIRKWEVDEINFAILESNGNLKWKGSKGVIILRNQGDEVVAVSNGWSYDFYDKSNNLLQLE